MNIEVYLGKEGKTFGPYTPDQFEALKLTPEYAGYTYVWDGRDPAPEWKAIVLPKQEIKAAPRKGPGAPPPDHAPVKASPAAQISITPTISIPVRRPRLQGY